MKTLYIDIYFLVNFTVDIISLHFAALFSKIKVSNRRLLFSALVGGIVACLTVLVDYPLIDIVVFTCTIVFASIFCGNNAGPKGKAAFGISLIVFLSLVGGMVSFVWNMLEDAFSDYLIENDVVNRKMLFFALIALLSIGVFKMLIAVMNFGKVEAVAEINIEFMGRSSQSMAWVDTGNLALDPLGMKPVLIIKKELAERFVPQNIINLTDVDLLDRGVKKKIRLVPLAKNGVTHVYIGFVPDKVEVRYNNRLSYVDVTIVIDKEGGDFGGYLALMPFSAISNATS